MNCLIIPTTEEYIEKIWTVLDNVAREREFIAFLEGPPLERFRAFVRENIKKNSPQFIALVDDMVVGWCDLTKLDRPVSAHCARLGIGVLKEYRGRGIGKALLQTALEKARLSRLTRIELEVRERNIRAIDLYKKLGFFVEGIKQNGIRQDGIYENIICMGLLLEE